MELRLAIFPRTRQIYSLNLQFCNFATKLANKADETRRILFSDGQKHPLSAVSLETPCTCRGKSICRGGRTGFREMQKTHEREKTVASKASSRRRCRRRRRRGRALGDRGQKRSEGTTI